MSDGLLEYTPTAPDVPHPLGRSVLWHDERNRNYRALDRPLALAPRPWWVRHVFDQRGSSCTMQAAAGVAHSSPFRTRHRSLLAAYDTEEERHAGYLRAQRDHDPWLGGEPDYEGSSTDAPYKLLRAEGLIAGWAWYFGSSELAEGVRRAGPASVGTIWLWSMFDVDADGYVVVDRSSGPAGGHAYEVIWYDVKGDYFSIVNSWGRDWGRNGRARIRGADMRYLLDEKQGEACTILAA